MLPLILSEELAASDIGESALKLEEVCQLAVAPRLTFAEIENNLHFTIVEYLDLRIKLIEDINAPSVRPKHHFLSHYADLYLEKQSISRKSSKKRGKTTEGESEKKKPNAE